MDFRARLAKRLILLGQLFGQPAFHGGTRITLKLSQRDLASHIGVTRESINKVLKEWESQKVITNDGGRFVLLDRNRLAVLAESSIAT